MSGYTVNCSILLTELPLLDRPRAAREAGFDAVEFWWPFDRAVPTDREVEEFVAAVADAGVRLTGLNFAGGDMAAGERGLLSNPASTTEFRDNVAVAVEIGRRLGTGGFNALYGNRRAEISPDRQDAAARENLAFAGRAAAEIGAVVLIEPLSAVPAYPLRLARDAVAVCDAVQHEHGVNNLVLLADLYHLHVNGDDIAAAIDAHADRIGHVQIADAPGRGAPGTGEIGLTGFLDQLARNGYRGRIGLEYHAPAATAFDWLRATD
ncbi:TIM barrel protein [Aldersonia sp. NBC_00410]|uniref:hydroxypyruvate isomerase family protein n=1 Tax=Aldersonia sp. NBC_00410 TaxID=2975954 RepID=UPI00225AF1BE|nr:TIM barrel protein [Aldersonia sp. NBC_00410]MCX5044363.1 TIM barrel protein [Aldersonia sp. NBC_00410]